MNITLNDSGINIIPTGNAGTNIPHAYPGMSGGGASSEFVSRSMARIKLAVVDVQRSHYMR